MVFLLVELFSTKNRFLLQQQKDEMGERAPTPNYVRQRKVYTVLQSYTLEWMHRFVFSRFNADGI